MSFHFANGILLHYRALGPSNAPALVFANALGSDMRIWDEVAPAFADRYRVVLYDKRGHGLSDAPPGPYELDDHVDDLLGLLAALDVQKFSMIGLSVGGLIAQRMALCVADRLTALILCATAAKIGTPELWDARIAAVESAGLAPIADAVLQRWFTLEFMSRRPADYAGWRNLLERTSAAGYAATCATIRDADLRDYIAMIAVPTLCIVGDQDSSTPPDLVRDTAARIPGVEVEIIRASGHLPCIEQPAALVGLIDRHLQIHAYA